MIKSVNNAYIDGVLNEIDLKSGDKDGRNYIAGKLTMLVEQTVSDKVELEEIPVQVFAYDKTNAGKDSQSYKALKTILESGVSVAACGNEEEADKYSIGGGSISVNKFAKDGKLITYPQIRGSFFNKITKQFMPKATFEQTIVVKNIRDEEKDDEPTGRLLIDGIVIQYNEVPDIITYVVESPRAIQYIRDYYNKNDTIKISGVIRYTVTTENKVSDEDVGFGEPDVHVVKKTCREFVVTSGSASPLTGESAFDVGEVIDALEKETIREKKMLADEGKTSKSNDRGF